MQTEAPQPPTTQWFAWREVQPSLEFARTGQVALHYFTYDLRRFGLSRHEPSCHILSSDQATLIDFCAQLGLPSWLLQPDRPHRPGVFHFDAFGVVLERLIDLRPLPLDMDLT